jgi:hypothetical protein
MPEMFSNAFSEAVSKHIELPATKDILMITTAGDF